MPPRQNTDVNLLRQQVDNLAIGLDELRTRQTEMHEAQLAFFARIERLLPGDNRGRDRGTRHHHRSPPSSDDDTLTVDNPFADLDPHGASRGGDGNRWETSFRLDIPEFSGNGEDDAALDWLHAVEELLEFKGVPPDRRVALVATRLRERASAWWVHTKRDRVRQRKPPILDWDKFRKYFEREFLPRNYSRLVYQRLQNLRQGSRSVAAYSAEFYQLLCRNDLSETPEQLVSRYIGGLRVPFQDSLNLFNPRTISEAHQHASTLEKQFNRKPQWLNPVVGGTERRPTPITDNKAVDSSGHHQPEGSSSFPARSANAGKCFTCGDPNHRMASCPKRHTGRAFLAHDIEGDAVDSLPIYDEDPNDVPAETHLHGDEGVSLVLRRACLTPRSDEDLVQRHLLFHSTCTVNGKVCKFIIDSGSCENVISTDTVSKLALATVSHPTPYQLAWLKRDNLVSVDKRVLLKFSIGDTYVDSVWCDVVPMDACHILLGRPWQFDRRVLHDGYSNTYSFMFGGVKLVLHPTVPRVPSLQQAPTTVQLLTRAAFERELCDDVPTYLLLAHDVTQPDVVHLLLSLCCRNLLIYFHLSCQSGCLL